ncbi:C39 family peptidase [Lactobacillus sp. Sy-1]|uniref:C39 family peptidase n=1 Tax=Lactobacillus sp. Sy-1 TaxID=2109645 RepID=UPI001C5A8A92|nr:C39 family peptidase [Lactobacillus sp. Sy-1]MBW1606226.1 C39 family peptidase [Lactobacillus sp. Sy-1]
MSNIKKKLIIVGSILFVILAASTTLIGSGAKKIPGTYSERPIVKNAGLVELNAPFISQKEIKAWNGCEAASLLQAFHLKGVLLKTNLRSFLAQMPISKDNNPYNGYAGSPYIKNQSGVFQTIFPKPLAKWGSKYHKVTDISGSSTNELKKQVKAGNPVITYIISYYEKPSYQKYFWGTGITNSHVVLLDGYERGYYHVSDPNRGKYWVKGSRFEAAYNYKKYAVAVQ